jgi:uncharacterized membrane protein YcjF (UPF0283 family)
MTNKIEKASAMFFGSMITSTVAAYITKLLCAPDWLSTTFAVIGLISIASLWVCLIYEWAIEKKTKKRK